MGLERCFLFCDRQEMYHVGEDGEWEGLGDLTWIYHECGRISMESPWRICGESEKNGKTRIV